MKWFHFPLFLLAGIWITTALARQPAAQTVSSPASLKMSESEREVWKLEEASMRFLKTHDEQAYSKLWDERFAGWPRFDPAPIHKDKIREGGSFFMNRKILDYKLQPLSVRDYGETIVITLYRATVHSTDKNGGDERTHSSRLTHTWMKTAAGWQIIGGMSSSD